MIIELRGVEFINKGAELMLHAITKKIREEFSDVVFVMEKGGGRPLEKLRKNDIFMKLNGGTRYSKLGRYLPKPVRRKLCYVLAEEVEIVLDSSGFAFGDQWGAAYAERRLGSRIVKWKRDGKKIILLPQAFGPFEDPELKKVIGKILTHSDLVFVRERCSYEHLQGIPGKEKVIQAPDFTNLVKGVVPADFDPAANRVAIIPNHKMIEKGGAAETYLKFLSEAVYLVRKAGLNPYFLIHEGARDEAIAKQVNELLRGPIPLIGQRDPLEVKGIISTASFVICSRFHGVVSALSQGVPCIATSWSHKYEMLLREYQYSEGLVDPGDLKSLKELIGRLADARTNREISEKLSRHSEIHKRRALEMWEKVFEIIRSNDRSWFQ